MVARLVLATLTLALLLAACGGGESASTDGAELYQQSCAACHGASGLGGSGGPAIGPGSNATTLTDPELAAVIRNGQGTMPGFPNLSDTQVDAIVAFVRGLGD